jgi:NtrC-family two-component system response regulator AlgB
MDSALRASEGASVVLVQGESGVGKQTLCRAIHSWGPRAHEPLGVTSCRAPSRTYLERELFGATRVGPGGTSVEQLGRVASCERGTLLIEDVERLPESSQSKLLRLIEHGEYEPADGFFSRAANIRVLATSSADLGQRARDGSFHPDLLAAMAASAIFIPPLRQRPEDAVMLTERYLAFFARQTRRNVVGFSHGAIDSLRRHSWPGNIRELRGLVERAVLTTQSEQIETSDFPPGTLNRVNAVSLGDPVPLERIEELHIRGVLAGAPSIEVAAATLGIDTVTLWRRRKRYGI